MSNTLLEHQPWIIAGFVTAWVPFHEHGKQNSVQPFLRSRKLLRLHTCWTELHSEVMTWISGTYECHYAWPLPKANSLLCVIWWCYTWTTDIYFTTVFAIWSLEYWNNQSCSKGWKWYTGQQDACNESYRSHDKKTEQCLLLCIVLNFSVNKLPSLPLYSTFICTPCMHFTSVHSWRNLEYRNNWSCSI